MKITQSISNTLTDGEKVIPRLRMNMDLSNQSQRMLNAIELGSSLPIHRYKKNVGSCSVSRGRLVVEFDDDIERTCTEAIERSPDGPIVALDIPAGQWHTVRALIWYGDTRM